MKTIKTLRDVPLPGQRILRSMIAVWLCFAIYFIRGRHGIPFYSVIAALQCLQPYNRDMHAVARKRMIGTLIGAAWGLAVLLLELELIHHGVPDELPHYLLLGLATGLVLYSAVLLKVPETAYFSCVVFLSVAVNHIGDENPYLFAFNRLLDTTLGVLSAEAVNRVHLPRLRNTRILFAPDLNGVLIDRNLRLSPYTKVELNRLIEDGAHITLATSETQATVRELLPGVHFRDPIVTMNGCALYDTSTMEYLAVCPMTPEQTRRLMDWADGLGLGYFSNHVEKNLLVVRYRSLANPAMEQIYAGKRSSPYRNFVRTGSIPCGSVLYLFLPDTEEAVNRAYEDLALQPWASEYRIVRGEARGSGGYAFLKIYDAAVSKEAMLRVLAEKLGTEETVTLRAGTPDCTVPVNAPETGQAVKEIKKRFEPVDLHGWKNMFRI